MRLGRWSRRGKRHATRHALSINRLEARRATDCRRGAALEGMYYVLQRLMLLLPDVLPLGLVLELPLLGLVLLGLVVLELLLELPRLELPELVPVPREASARSAATQSSNATPVIPTQREGVEEDAEGPLVEVSEDDELVPDGLVALGEVVLPVEPGEVVLPVEPTPAEPDVPVLGEEALGLALESVPEALPELCARTTPLASALAATTASAFRGKCFIRFSMSEAARSAPMHKQERKRHATKHTFAIKRLRERRRAHCRADAALQSEQ